MRKLISALFIGVAILFLIGCKASPKEPAATAVTPSAEAGDAGSFEKEITDTASIEEELGSETTDKIDSALEDLDI